VSADVGGLLRGSEEPLLAGYDAVLFDLDGVLQLGPEPVSGGAEAVAAARDAGRAVGFVTNNASRTPADVVDHLARVGVHAEPHEVVTSSMAAARLVADTVAPGAPVLVVGGPGLEQAAVDAGLEVVASADARPVAVLQGWGPQVCWAQLAEATVAVRAGARWIATNTDRTLPTPRGQLPGSGALVAAVATALGRAPDAVAGKPHRALFDAALAATGATRALFVGDRLDTDVRGARVAGLDSLAVLTGVATPAQLLHAAAEDRPTYVGCDARAVAAAHPTVHLDGDRAACGGVTVTSAGEVRPAAGAGSLEALRAACALAWSGRADPA
jgi:HAD superfamily hydrolase (TIGR01450 family)